MTFAINLFGWIGAAALLTAYWLVSTQKAPGNSKTYQGMNLLGAVLVLVNSLYYGAYPSVGVNAVWIAIGAYTLANHVYQARRNEQARRIAVAAAIIVTGGLVLHAAQTQLAGTRRIDLQRHDLSVPGHEVVQTIVELEPGVTSSRHTHPGDEIVYVLEGAPLQYRSGREGTSHAETGRRSLHRGRHGPRGQERRQPERCGAGHLHRRKRKAAAHRGRRSRSEVIQPFGRRYAHRGPRRRIRRCRHRASPGAAGAPADRCRDYAREPRELLRAHTEACSGSMELRHCAQPIPAALRRARFIEATVESVDLERQLVRALAPEGGTHDLPYDHLVVASRWARPPTTGLIPGPSNALTFKTMADALVLRNHLIERFEARCGHSATAP